MKKLLFILGSCFVILNAKAQDFIRLGATHDFASNKVLNIFSFAFNRTEAEEADVAKYLSFNIHSNIFILPTSEVNIGDGVTSSENNVLVQFKIGKLYLPTVQRSSTNPLRTYVWRQSIEFNPSYNSDKEFNERLYFGQLRYGANYVSQVFSGAVPGSYITSVHSIALGPFGNFGSRNSKTYDASKFYSTTGAFFEYTFRDLNQHQEENWVAAISGNYYYIISDIDAITNDNFGGIIKTSLDRRIYKKFSIGLQYKYGNDNPNYAYVHTLGLSAKISY
ncbi:hypothetical protein [Mucilaginibacter psychrotolerans]|uniref:DUF481 domain-containing protein n=1 Tax=Mucilaginibacter psychrotolerans TaxID=1524096 RepID=A0A4Y8SCX9_9SPHI|nr:hypothetical protein [Mucilaginibacter psychrotolerans]TFF36196.1 hypothetical protein E2R66_16785 [Mucilaginibacter psychrotolerans]